MDNEKLHEILTEIKEEIATIKACMRCPDHETRIRRMEKSMWLALGAFTAFELYLKFFR